MPGNLPIKTENFECFVCEKSFKRENILSKHHLQVHELNDGFTISETFNKSMKNENHENETFQCDLCGKNFMKNEELTSHLLNLHLSVNFKCDICELVLPNLQLLVMHVTYKHREKFQHKCQLCQDKPFPNSSKLIEHYLGDHLNMKYNCKDCNKSFKNRNNLQSHVKLVHAKPNSKTSKFDQLKCQICNEVYSNENLLQEHYLIDHMKLVDLICEECDKSFPDLKTLCTHKSKTHKVKKVSCQICTKKFLRFHGFSRHLIQDHLDIKEYL